MRKSAKIASTAAVVIPSRAAAAAPPPPPKAHARTSEKKKRDSSATPDVLAKALRAEFKPRKKGTNSAVHKAKFLQAQQRIRKDLGIQNRVDATTYIALGRVLDGVARRVIERTGNYLNYNTKFGDNHGDGTRKLTERIAVTAIRSFFAPGKDPVWDQIYSNMDTALKSYHAADTGSQQQQSMDLEPDVSDSDSE